MILWCFVLVLQYYTEEVNCQLHVEVRNYLSPFSSSIDTHTTLYEFDEPELSPLNQKWFNFYPYANIELNQDIFGLNDSSITGYLYEIRDCDVIREPYSGNIRLPTSHNLWFAFISNYSQNCHSRTIARLKYSRYYMLFTYNNDGDQTISQEDKDSEFPIAILTENHALELLSYYDNANFSSGITSDIPVIFIVRTEIDRGLNIVGSSILYMMAGIFGLCILGALCRAIYEGITYALDSCSDVQDDAPANNIELRNITRRNREERESGENGRSASQVQSTTTARETRINMENVQSTSRVQSTVNRNNGRSTSTADKKQIRKYDPQSDSEQTCTICFESFVAGVNVRCLDCDPNHIFHSHCLSKWFSKNKSCPLCRAKSQ